jgi:3-hydroxyisobutyrate dehydrogenase
MMGSGFVEAMRRRGDEVNVWNRTLEKAKALERFGARAFEDPAEAVRGVDRIHLMLGDDASVDGVLTRIEGALAPQIFVIDHTTVSPAGTAARYARMDGRGIPFLHAPVFMSPQACRDATGLMLCSAPRERFERVEGELKKMTGELWYLGEPVEKAAGFKLLGNMMLFFVVSGFHDVYATAKAMGIAPTDAHTLFSHFRLNAAIEMRGAAMARGQFTPPSFELAMARKDMRLMLEAAERGGSRLEVLPAMAAQFDRALAEGHGHEDVGVIAADVITERVTA